MCERTSAMFAIRACRAYCIKNYDAYPSSDSKYYVIMFFFKLIIKILWIILSECGVPGGATTVVEMANQFELKILPIFS